MTKQEKSIITNLLRDPGNRVTWDTLQKIAQERIERLKMEKPNKDTEWDLIQSTLKREYEIEGIKGFFNEIENYVK